MKLNFPCENNITMKIKTRTSFMAGEEALDLWNVLNKSLNFNLDFTFKM
jgi:hypothetical protein